VDHAIHCIGAKHLGKDRLLLVFQATPAVSRSMSNKTKRSDLQINLTAGILKSILL